MTDTIAAIATPPGAGGIGVVRVSGPSAASTLKTLVPDWPEGFASHTLRLSRIHDLDGALIDESLAVLMRGPKSYTGEDVVELQCHGGPIILRRVLDACLESGARIAQPGEFTQRAYLNGRLDLTQAEAVADLVNATTESAHALAIEHLQGSLGDEISTHRDRLAEAMVLIESAIDFSLEEHVYQIERDEILERLDAVLDGLTILRHNFDQGRRQREGVRVVIMGPTNAGKSTLFNALHGTERAIVTNVPGTTRDFIEEEIHLAGVSLRVFDTAGLRQTRDQVEALGIERSRGLSQRADVVVWLVDGSRELDEDTREELSAMRAHDCLLVVMNKCDLERGLSAEDLDLLSDFETLETSLAGPERDGFDVLLDRLAEIALELTSGEGVLISRARHLQHVVEAIEATERAKVAVQDQLDHELVALDVREALDALGEIVGHVTTDDVLHRIFAEFCVGK